MKVFIAGAKNIKTLDADVQRRVASICEKGNDILVGDCYGVDSSVQKLCAKRGYPRVTVYASNGLARNNIGHWAVKDVEVNTTDKGFDFYRQKDIAMSRDADCGYMVWDGESKGTLCNIISLVLQNKLVLVRLVQVTKTVQIRTTDDLARLIAACPAATRENFKKFERQAKAQMVQPTQLSMFS